MNEKFFSQMYHDYALFFSLMICIIINLQASMHLRKKMIEHFAVILQLSWILKYDLLKKFRNKKEEQ